MTLFRSPRQGLIGVARQLSSPRQCMTTLTGFTSPRQALIDVEAVRSSPRQASMELEGAEFSHYWSNVQLVAATWGDELRDIVPQPIPLLYLNGVELTALLRKLEIKRPLNGKSSLTFTLNLPADEDGIVILPSDLCPPGFGLYAGLIRAHNRSSSSLLKVTVSIAGEQRELYFLPTAPKFDGYSLEWGGEDIVGLAEAEGQNGSDILADTGDNVTAHASIKADASGVGLEVACKFPDYRLGEFRKGSGTRLAWMDRAAKPMQPARRTEGKTLVYQALPTVLDGAQLPVHRWEFIDRHNIKDLELRQMQPAKNRFEAVRLSSVATILEDPKTCTGPSCIGRKRIDLNSPIAGHIQIQVAKVVSGGLFDFVFFGKDDTPVGGPNSGFYSGHVPVAYFEFTYVPQISNFAYIPSFELYIRGGSPQSTQAAVAEGFRASAEDAASITEVGENPEFANLEDPIFYDPETANATVRAHLNASVLKAWEVSFGTPYLNPLMDPGDIIRITDLLTRQERRKYLVTLLTLTWERYWEMKIDAVRPAHGT